MIYRQSRDDLRDAGRAIVGQVQVGQPAAHDFSEFTQHSAGRRTLRRSSVRLFNKVLVLKMVKLLGQMKRTATPDRSSL